MHSKQFRNESRASSTGFQSSASIAILRARKSTRMSCRIFQEKELWLLLMYCIMTFLPKINIDGQTNYSRVSPCSRHPHNDMGRMKPTTTIDPNPLSTSWSPKHATESSYERKDCGGGALSLGVGTLSHPPPPCAYSWWRRRGDGRFWACLGQAHATHWVSMDGLWWQAAAAA